MPAGKAGKNLSSGNIYIGTSGFSYREWVGPFYPAHTGPSGMLGYYAGRFNAVEVNSTFYRLPSPGIIQTWRQSAGPGFRFAIKASQRITHRPDFGLAEGFLDIFLSRIALLQKHLGPLLFQFPPHFGRLETALGFVKEITARIPRLAKTDPVMEVRHPALLQAEFFESLAAAGVNLCCNDEYLEPGRWPEPAGIAYVRLRRETYGREELKALARRLKKWSCQGKDSYVFFQHEGRAFELAGALQRLT